MTDPAELLSCKHLETIALKVIASSGTKALGNCLIIGRKQMTINNDNNFLQKISDRQQAKTVRLQFGWRTLG